MNDIYTGLIPLKLNKLNMQIPWYRSPFW